MSAIEPFINLLVILTVLSVISERVTNILKFNTPTLRDRKLVPEEERIREGQIQSRTIIVGIIIALITKADLFAFITHLDDPWSTLGWVRVVGTQWFQAPATQSLGAILYSVGGCLLTGLSLGFGSKFWHDILSTVFELRNIARNKGSGIIPVGVGNEPDNSESNGDNND